MVLIVATIAPSPSLGSHWQNADLTGLLLASLALMDTFGTEVLLARLAIDRTGPAHQRQTTGILALGMAFGAGEVFASVTSTRKP